MYVKSVSLGWLLAILIIFGPASAEVNAVESTFTSTDTPLLIPLDPDQTSGTTTSNIEVGQSCQIDDLNVTVDISHTYDGDLILNLEGMDIQVLLSHGNGGGGYDYSNTTFDDEAAADITTGSAPFDGIYAPEGNLSDFYGMDAAGTWTLRITDRYNGDAGQLNSWSITFDCQVAKLDHYLTYKVKAEPKFEKTDVILTDQFQSSVFTVEKRETLMTPVNKNGEGISDSTTHLLGYKVNGGKFKKVRDVLVENQFGQLLVGLENPEDLLVPASQSLVDPLVPAPNNDLHNVNHFLCYKVKPSAGKSAFPPITGVHLVDQFENKVYDIVKPKRLCTPVDKNGEGIKLPDPAAPADHLFCYEARQSAIFVNDQFGPGELDTRTKKELCVPSTMML